MLQASAHHRDLRGHQGASLVVKAAVILQASAHHRDLRGHQGASLVVKAAGED